MAHTRGPRAPGDLEVGIGDVFMSQPEAHIPPRDDRPQWLLTWEAKRPRWVMELIAEALGVFIYCWGGMGAACAFYVQSVAKENGFGSVQSVAYGYGLSIAIALVVTGATSGSHINPCYTIAFAIFKGFPWRKVPQYIAAQILGGTLAGLIVYLQYKQPLDLIADELTAAGLHEMIFSTTGPATPIALFTGPGQKIGYVLVNEFMGGFLIAVAIFSILDPSNIFISIPIAPFLIGCTYFVTIISFSSQSLSLNTARDLGGRFAAGIIWGRGAFPPAYSALAALTNILSTLCGAAFQILILSDSTRPIVNSPPGQGHAGGKGGAASKPKGRAASPAATERGADENGKGKTEHYENDDINVQTGQMNVVSR